MKDKFVKQCRAVAREDNSMDIHPIASVPFVDGVSRPVFFDADCRQHVLDNDWNPVYGVWVYIDELEIVERHVE